MLCSTGISSRYIFCIQPALGIDVCTLWELFGEESSLRTFCDQMNCLRLPTPLGSLPQAHPSSQDNSNTWLRLPPPLRATLPFPAPADIFTGDFEQFTSVAKFPTRPALHYFIGRCPQLRRWGEHKRPAICSSQGKLIRSGYKVQSGEKSLSGVQISSSSHVSLFNRYGHKDTKKAMILCHKRQYTTSPPPPSFFPPWSCHPDLISSSKGMTGSQIQPGRELRMLNSAKLYFFERNFFICNTAQFAFCRFCQ